MVISILMLVLAFMLVLLNAFFVAAEFSMVKLRHTRLASIRRNYGLRGKILTKVHAHLDAYLSACQLGITLASLGLGWLGEPAFSVLLEPLLVFAGIESHELLVVISFLCAFSVISFLHIVVGELVPKSLAIRQSEIVSVWTAIPLYGFYWLMYPAIAALNFCANFILKITKLDVIHKDELNYSPDELKLILNSSFLHDQLSKQETNLLRHSIELVDLEVIDVMRPSDEMIVLEADHTINQSLSTILKHRYSRYPIVDEELEEIIGIVHIKDILLLQNQAGGDKILRSIMRPILKVRRNLSAVDLLNKLQEGMPHFALVYGEREHPIGFVTLDNILQVLVGRVRDEFHKIGESWTRAADGAFLMSGGSPIYVLERALNIDVDMDEETSASTDTILGLILITLERLPHQGEHIEFSQFTMVINKMKGHKLLEVAVYPKNLETNDD